MQVFNTRRLRFSFKRLYGHKLYEWKVIPLLFIKFAFGVNFKFHSNLDFNDSKILTFSLFYKQLFRSWRKYLFCSFNIPSSILSLPTWYKFKTWNEMKIRYTYNNISYFKQTQENCQFSSQNLEKSTQKISKW